MAWVRSLARALFALSLATGAAACREAGNPRPADSAGAPGPLVSVPAADAADRASASPAPSAPEPGARTRRGGMDLTFLVTADTHFGHPGVEALHERAIQAMNASAGRSLPKSIGGRVGKPAGLLVAGDLTEDGRPEEWQAFESFFGLRGDEGKLGMPVFEALGNHDRHTGAYVEAQIARRHGGRRYTWDWQDVHFVCFAEAPDEEDSTWLRADLARTGHDVGVVLLFHFPLTGPYSNGWWWAERHREALRAALEGYRVLGIFHGHYHATGSYRWHGIDAYNPGSVKHGVRSFLAVQLDDQHMTVGAWSYAQDAWIWWHDKPIFEGREREQLSLAGAIIGQPGWDRARE